MKAAKVLPLMAVAVALVASSAAASVTFTPPDKNKVMMSSVRLMPQQAGSKASGVVSVVSNPSQSKYTLTIEARGLVPGSVYTVAFTKRVNANGKSTMQMQGAGTAPFTLPVNSAGSASATYNLTANPKAQWTNLVIVQHPNKNPRSMAGIVPVLSADLTQLGK